MGPGSAKQRCAKAARCIAPGTRGISILNTVQPASAGRSEFTLVRVSTPRRAVTAMQRTFFGYIVASRRNGTLYIGLTNNLARRIFEHKAGLVPGFTRQYGVNLLVHF